jgi:hypothetical protein
MLTILTALYLKANADAVGLHQLLGSHPLLALPCWTLGSTSIHLTLPVWTPASLGRLSASLIFVCAVRLPPIKFTCRRRRWRTNQVKKKKKKQQNTDADTFAKSCPPRCSGFRWTLHIIFFGRAPA